MRACVHMHFCCVCSRALVGSRTSRHQTSCVHSSIAAQHAHHACAQVAAFWRRALAVRGLAYLVRYSLACLLDVRCAGHQPTVATTFSHHGTTKDARECQWQHKPEGSPPRCRLAARRADAMQDKRASWRCHRGKANRASICGIAIWCRAGLSTGRLCQFVISPLKRAKCQ